LYVEPSRWSARGLQGASLDAFVLELIEGWKRSVGLPADWLRAVAEEQLIPEPLLRASLTRLHLEGAVTLIKGSRRPRSEYDKLRAAARRNGRPIPPKKRSDPWWMGAMKVDYDVEPETGSLEELLLEMHDAWYDQRRVRHSRA
jgi:hypothetical protein